METGRERRDKEGREIEKDGDRKREKGQGTRRGEREGRMETGRERRDKEGKEIEKDGDRKREKGQGTRRGEKEGRMEREGTRHKEG